MTLKQKLVWLAIGALWLVLFGRMLMGQAPPEPPKVYLRASGVTQGSGARALLKKPTPARVVTIPWRYASDYTNVWFNLQASADMRTWITIQSNCTGTLTITNAGERFRCFRLAGRFTP